MPAPGYLQVSDLRDMLRAVTDHTRPAYDAEILSALNYGYQTVLRAIMSVRSQFFEATVDNFTIPAATSSPPPAVDVDLSWLEPPLWRPTRLVATESSATRGAIFRYRSLVAMETIGSEQQAYSGGYNAFYYDILSGRVQVATTKVSSVVPSNTLAVTDAVLRVGHLVEFVGATYRGRVRVGVAPPLAPYTSVFTDPVFPGTPGTPNPAYAGLTVKVVSSSTMRVADPTSSSVTGKLYYQYKPRRFTDFDDYLDPIITDYADVIVHYAISQYLLAVNDADSNAWLQKAQLLRSELMQDLEPLSGDSSEALGSDLWGTD